MKKFEYIIAPTKLRPCPAYVVTPILMANIFRYFSYMYNDNIDLHVNNIANGIAKMKILFLCSNEQ